MKPATLLAVAMLLAAGHALADDAERFIAVDGSATVSAAPDIATLRMAVSARSTDLDAARAEVVRTTRRFLEFSDDQDIDESDVQTSALSIRPEYRWNNEENRQELLGYVVQRDIVVQLDDLDKLGDLMEGAVSAGVNQVEPPALGHSNERELRRDALAAATLDARANASRIASALGVTLGAARRVSASQQVVPRPFDMKMTMAVREAAADGGDTYNVGEITIEASVSAEFAIAAEE